MKGKSSKVKEKDRAVSESAEETKDVAADTVEKDKAGDENAEAKEKDQAVSESAVAEDVVINVSEKDITALAVIEAEAKAYCTDYNNAVLNGDLKAAASASRSITDKVNEYTAKIKRIVYDVLEGTGNPMLAAVKVLSFETIATKDEKRDDSEIKVRTIVRKDKRIDLKDLHEKCVGGIGHDKNWIHNIQKLNCLLTARVAKSVDKTYGTETDLKEIYDSYQMSSVARDFDLGKTPTSNTQLLKVLQIMVTQMLGDGYKATSHDVNYLTNAYSKRSKEARTLKMPSHGAFRDLMMDVCNAIVTGKGYRVEYKKKKD